MRINVKETSVQEQEETKLAHALDTYKQTKSPKAKTYLENFLAKAEGHDCHLSDDDGCFVCELVWEVRTAL